MGDKVEDLDLNLSEEGKKFLSLFISMKEEVQFIKFERWLLKRQKKFFKVQHKSKK